MFVSSSMVAFDKLKTTEATTFRSKTFNFSKSYVSKDMTKSKAEQEVNHYLVLELTLKRKNDPLHQCTRWPKFLFRPRAHSLIIDLIDLIDFNIMTFWDTFF